MSALACDRTSRDGRGRLVGVKLMREVMYSDDRPTSRRDDLVLWVVAYNATHRDRICRVSMDVLQHRSRLSHDSLRSALSNLVRDGFLETTTTTGRGKPQRYRLADRFVDRRRN